MTFAHQKVVGGTDSYRPMKGITHPESAANNIALDLDKKSELYPTIRIMRTSIASKVQSFP
jgi:hypothetical protein